MKKKILAISGSIRAKSSNLSILRLIADMMPVAVQYEIYSGLDTIPLFNPDLDTETVAQTVTEFRKKIKDADGILFCTPEYAFGVPGALKNALDWTVSSGEFTDKPVALITASSQGSRAHESLQHTLSAIGTKFTKEETLLISFIKAKMDQEGTVTNVATLASLKTVIAAFLKSLHDSEK